MKTTIKNLALFLITFALLSCSVETESHVVETSKLKLNASGPMFQGPNTATTTWEYNLRDILPIQKGKIEIVDAKILTIQIKPIQSANYPKIGKIVMEMKPKEGSMLKVGLLNTDFIPSQTNTFEVAEEQADMDEMFSMEKITFVADFDMLEEEYYEDVDFDLNVTFEVKTKK